jgi:hypothetical protein
MQMFYLNRRVDKSGVSGTGIVAEGVVFTNGKCALTWLSEHPSVTIYDCIEEVEKIHGHDGLTRIVFAEDLQETAEDEASLAFRSVWEPLHANRLVQLVDSQRFVGGYTYKRPK